MPPRYVPTHPARSRKLALRTLQVHVHEWGDAGAADAQRPTLLLAHGWMDVGASFQFLVDAMASLDAAPRHIIAADWRGFGQTTAAACDAYWFADYLGDLDALIDAVAPTLPVDLLGHSMGGNVVMIYAAVRPRRVRRLINLEGFGLPDSRPDEAPQRLQRWLDELRAPPRLRDYADADEVAARLAANSPRLDPARAGWLARQWAAPGADGRWRLRADPAHKRIHPVLYRAQEAVALWAAIEAPVLWVEGSDSDPGTWWGDRYLRSDFEQRLSRVRNLQTARIEAAGHMLHLEQPQALAAAVTRFLR